jgi:hypothetical protein
MSARAHQYFRMIFSAIAIASEMHVSIAGLGRGPSCASLRAASIEAAFRITRFRPSSTGE